MGHRAVTLTSCLAAGLLLVSAHRADATYDDLMGFPQLQAQLGGATPTGAGIAVSQVEAPETPGGANYFVNTALAGFGGKTILDATGGGAVSSHANHVGLNFYGNSTSIAPDLANISVYNANHWAGIGFLRTGQNALPFTTASRIVNHSWIGSGATNADTGQFLRRYDYTVETDDLIQVAGLPNTGNSNVSLFKDSYNGISVGLTSAAHVKGTLAVDSVYIAGRVAPTVVAPGFRDDNAGTATSWATPMVSAGVALLLQTGQNAAHSHGTITNRTRTINNAEASEVVKALLMAGADRSVDNPRGADLTDYAIDTTNNLDSRYGAGQMNIYNSHRILTAGEQDAGSNILARGWDYNPAFVADGLTDAVASYFFSPADVSQTQLTASLVWNLDVNINAGSGVITTASHNLDLQLIDLSDLSVVAQSASTIHNTENLWDVSLVLGHDYELRVLSGGEAFTWDYALAWQTIPEPAAGLVAFAFAVLLSPRRRGGLSRA